MRSVCVIGAGVVGTCCALYLKKKGLEVTLLDRYDPGSQTSFGNAGVIHTGGIAPYASPDIVPMLPSFGFNRDPRFLLHWPHFFLLLPWMMKFVRRCNWTHYRECMSALSYLCEDSVALHSSLLAENDSSHLLRERGWLRLYATNALFESTARERENYDNHGVPYEVLDRDEISNLETHVSDLYEKAILLNGSPSVVNPHSITLAYLALFKKLGGDFMTAQASRLARKRDKWTVEADSQVIEADHVVIACGSRSTDLLEPLGIRIPMAIERGYHLIYKPASGRFLRGSICDIQKGLTMTPMDVDGEQVIRVTSGANLVARETTPDYRQILDLVPHIENMFPFESRISEEPWMGHRPSMPDSIPVIGPADQNLWCAFGHGHLGLTNGPKTGVLIAESITGEINDERAKAFLPARFF